MVQIGADKECRLRVGWHGAMDGNPGRRNFSLFTLLSNRIGGAFGRYRSRGNGIRGFQNSKCRLVLASHAIEAEPLNVAQYHRKLEPAKAEQDEEGSRDEFRQ
jgi:hypothetical protein